MLKGALLRASLVHRHIHRHADNQVNYECPARVSPRLALLAFVRQSHTGKTLRFSLHSFTEGKQSEIDKVLHPGCIRHLTRPYSDQSGHMTLCSLPESSRGNWEKARRIMDVPEIDCDGSRWLYSSTCKTAGASLKTVFPHYLVNLQRLSTNILQPSPRNRKPKLVDSFARKK